MAPLSHKFLSFCTRLVNRIKRLMTSPLPQKPPLARFIELFPANSIEKCDCDHHLSGLFVGGGPDATSNLFVSEIRRCKEHETLPYHEFVLAKIVDKSSSEPYLGWMRIERNREEAAAARSTVFDNSKRSSSPRRMTSLSPTSSISSSSINHRLAKDFVTTSADLKYIDADRGRPYKCTESYRLTPSQYDGSLLSLIAACCTVHKVDEEYNVFSANCYWYAGLVYEFFTAPLVGGDVALLTAPEKKPEGESSSRSNQDGSSSRTTIRKTFRRIMKGSQAAVQKPQTRNNGTMESGTASGIPIVSAKTVKKDADDHREVFEEMKRTIITKMEKEGEPTAREREMRQEAEAVAEEERKKAEKEKKRAENMEEQLRESEAKRLEVERQLAEFKRAAATSSAADMSVAGVAFAPTPILVN